MATFSNQATLTYKGNTTTSNIVVGELVETLAVDKFALEETYAPGALVTYVVSLRNTGTTALTNLTLTDDLGGYGFNGMTVYPLTYVTDSLRVFVDGAPQTAPTVTGGPPLTVSGITVPAGGNTVLVYQTRVNNFANPAGEGVIRNTVTVSGGGINTPVTATAEITAGAEAALTITKSISPARVTDNDRVTYTFVIQNFGAAAVVATDNAIITDTFDPILTNLAVTYAGTPWVQGMQYSYNEATGLFATMPGQIVVPAATYTQDPVTGAYTVTPGTVTLTVTGTI